MLNFLYSAPIHLSLANFLLILLLIPSAWYDFLCKLPLFWFISPDFCWLIWSDFVYVFRDFYSQRRAFLSWILLWGMFLRSFKELCCLFEFLSHFLYLPTKITWLTILLSNLGSFPYKLPSFRQLHLERFPLLLFLERSKESFLLCPSCVQL